MQTFSTCRVTFYPENKQEEDDLGDIGRSFVSELESNINYTFVNNRLCLAGWGTDKRCQLCHTFRKKAKDANILFLVRCPYEKDDSFSWRIQVGDSYFDISLLYKEEYYRDICQQEPDNLLARTHLAVISEYYGMYADALIEYLYILRKNPDDKFAKKRFKAVSLLLWQEKRQEFKKAQSMVIG